MTARRVAAIACSGALAVVVGFASTPAVAPAATPTRVIGTGTPRSCTSAAVVAAVRAGGRIRFSCGPKPVTIRMRATAKVPNTRREAVIDGGGSITLSGGGKRRILYMDTCDPAQRFTTSHCQDQATPRLTVANLTFTHGNSTGEDFDGGGGGAIFVRGGRLRIEHSSFVANRCDPEGPDVGGGAVRALSQYHGLPVAVVASRFADNVCSNGGALSSIGVSWRVSDSRFTGNRAIGRGANPARSGTPGGGSGGAIYNDGNRFELSITGSRLTGCPSPRAAERSSSSATTGPAPSRSRTASCSAIATTASTRPGCPASSTSAPAALRSATPSSAERLAPDRPEPLVWNDAAGMPSCVAKHVTDRSGIEKRGPRAAATVTAMDRPTTSGVTMTASPTQEIKTVLHPVSDLAKAKAVYAALLGVPPQTDSDYYVGFETAGQHIGLVPDGGPQGMTSPVAYWHVPDIEAKLAEVTAAGATVKEPVHDVGGGRLVATVTDPDGNVLGLLQDR